MTLLPRHPAQEHVKELARRSSHLAPLAGRGRDPRVCARMPGEGQRRIPKARSLVQPPKGPSPLPSPRKRGEGALCVGTGLRERDEMGCACPQKRN